MSETAEYCEFCHICLTCDLPVEPIKFDALTLCEKCYREVTKNV